MEFTNYYEILGVKASADQKDIKLAYRKLARQFHPDMNSDKNAENKFKEIAEAYHVLKNPKLRAEFDEVLRYGNSYKGQAGAKQGYSSNADAQYRRNEGYDESYSDFFNSIFGSANSSFRNQARPARGQDVEIELSLTLEETLSVTQKEVAFSIPSDHAYESPLKKHLKVKIPQGVADGERIRLSGQGKPGANEGSAGDLYLLIRVTPHHLFDVNGRDLLVTLPLAPWEAALGAKITVPTLEGNISLSVPAGTSTGQKLRVKGKGLKSKSSRGDLYAIVKIVLPSMTSEIATDMWRKLSLSEQFDPRASWSKDS